VTPTSSKFDATRAAEYAVQSRIALAGYDACHELAACLLSALLGQGSAARILVIGAGGSGLEVLSAGRLERYWHFTAVDPSPPMLGLAEEAVRAAGLSATTSFRLGTVQDVPTDAPFVLAGNRGAYAGNPRFLSAWRARWRMAGATDEEIEAKIGKILQGADPPDSDRDVETMLAEAGFCAPELFFSSLFWGGWIATRRQ